MKKTKVRMLMEYCKKGMGKIELGRSINHEKKREGKIINI
jgi:hypothetical protein